MPTYRVETLGAEATTNLEHVLNISVPAVASRSGSSRGSTGEVIGWGERDGRFISCQMAAVDRALDSQSGSRRIHLGKPRPFTTAATRTNPNRP